MIHVILEEHVREGGRVGRLIWRVVIHLGGREEGVVDEVMRCESRGEVGREVGGSEALGGLARDCEALVE